MKRYIAHGAQIKIPVLQLNYALNVYYQCSPFDYWFYDIRRPDSTQKVTDVKGAFFTLCRKRHFLQSILIIPSTFLKIRQHAIVICRCLTLDGPNFLLRPIPALLRFAPDSPISISTLLLHLFFYLFLRVFALCLRKRTGLSYE